MKKIQIHGKDYVEVNQRILYFRQNYKNYSLVTEFIELTENRCVMKATVLNEENRIVADGIAEEIKGSSHINKTSFIENCQTSAWGRALGSLGIGIDTNIASADEVKTAIEVQNNMKKTKEKNVILTDKKFDAMKKAIQDGKKDIVKKKMKNYILNGKQKKELDQLLENNVTTVNDIIDKLDNTIADYHDVEIFEMQQAEMNKVKNKLKQIKK